MYGVSSSSVRPGSVRESFYFVQFTELQIFFAKGFMASANALSLARFCLESVHKYPIFRLYVLLSSIYIWKKLAKSRSFPTRHLWMLIKHISQTVKFSPSCLNSTVATSPAISNKPNNSLQEMTDRCGKKGQSSWRKKLGNKSVGGHP